MTETMQKLKFLVIWKEQVVLVVGAASSRDHLISRLEAAPTGFFLVTWTFRISALKLMSHLLFGILNLGHCYLFDICNLGFVICGLARLG
jgi:hypothetical protein